RKEVDEFRSVVSDGGFDFGVVVGVLEEKISDEAYNSAERSEHGIIVTTYRNMCRNIKNLIAGRLSQEFRALEDIEDRFSPALSVTPQMPIPSSINGQSDKNDSTNSVNLEQAQIESEKTMNKIHDQNLDGSLSLSKPSINSDSTDPFEYNYDLSQPDKNQIVEQNLKQELSASPTSRKNIT
ncbi:5640_t:CDS:2, partial [Dentiscutata heterogama]